MSRRTVAVAIISILGLGVRARADRIILRGGGEIKGVVLPERPRPGHLLVQTGSSSRPIDFPREKVLKVIAEPGPLDEYLDRKDQIKATAEAQYEFGLWCVEQKLTGPAETHFRAAVALDPAFGPAHKKLGHVQYNGQWLSYDELRQAQGLVKHKGRWVSRQEKDRLDASAALNSEQKSWVRRLKVLRQKLVSDRGELRSQAENQLIAIRDPVAVRPLVSVFGADPNPIRVFLAQVIASIPGKEASLMLVTLVLSEPDQDVRRATLDELARRHESETVPRFTSALKSPDQVVLSRAAWALAQLNAASAVPKLIKELVRVERRIEMVMVGGGGSGGGVGGGGMGISSGFTTMGPGQPGSLPPGAAAAAPGFNTVRSVPYLTGPVVGPGVVAYGATSVPFVTGGGLGYGGGGGGGGTPKMVPQMLTFVYRNEEVLRALVKLTDVDFGFEPDQWRQWLAQHARPEPNATRRVPQP